jgi:hypothetical protein
MEYEIPEPEVSYVDGVDQWGYDDYSEAFSAEQMQAAYAAGRASRDAEVEALKADKQTLLSHMDTIMRLSNDPAIYSLAKVVTERFAIQED